MSVVSEITRLQGAKADIKSAIEAKGVTVPSDAKLDVYDDYVAQISGGGPTREFDDWVFNGDTHLWIEIVNPRQKEQQIKLRMTGTIDWGDGSTAESVDAQSSYTTFTHSYTELGRYRIDLHPTSGGMYLGGGSTNNCVMGSRPNSDDNYQRVSVLYQVEVGSSTITTITNYAFYYCVGIRRIYIPKNIISLGSSVFYSCTALHQIIFEDSSKIVSTSIASIFYSDYVLQDISTFILPSATSLSGLFRACYCIDDYTIPATVTSIGANCFYGMYSLKYLRCLPTSAPTVSNANAFTGFPAACVIQVPFGSLTSYQGAANWKTYKDQMVEAGAITLSLTNVSSSNKQLMVASGSSYTTTLSANEGYTLGTVTVTMGGVNITSTAYSAGVVTIASVTGNITITASGTSS